jgi:tetratricopeptide (TPR) repeat protein
VQAAGAPAVGAQVSPARAASLQAVGHRLLGEGSYSSAIGKLLEAVRSSGQSLAGCMEPASEACLTFAYALYDLGRALRLQGRHTEATAILSRRLQIDNQRSVVQRELELARSASS